MSDTVHKVADQTAAAVAPVSAGVATSDVAAEQPAIVAPEADSPTVPTAITGEALTTDVAAPAEESTTETAPAAATEAAVEPITEGQLGYKGPGLVKSLIASKKEFWLSDEPVTPQNLELYTRGEKPEIAHSVVAWASQTGRGLLFFNKKGETEKSRPHDVLALYDATDLKKESPHSFAFKLNGHNHTFKATSDAERDGWYVSIEKAIELGKASKDEIVGSEGYKSEHEKLSKPVAAAVAGAAVASKPKKSVEVDRAVAPTVGSDAEEEATADKKKKKSRSTSRGILNRLQGKKEEVEQKAAEKKEAKEEAKEEKKLEKEEAKEPETATDAAVPAVAAATVVDAPAAEDKPVEPVVDATETKTEEKPKPTKRGSIFGKLPATWGSFKSPSKEKEQKDAELVSAETPKEAVVSENPPVLPETATTSEPAAEATPVPAVEEPVTEAKPETPKEAATDVVTPNKEKKNFLSGLGGFMKRDRSVSPSTNFKEAPKKEEAAAPAVVEEASEPAVAKPEEPVAEAVTTDAAPVETTEPAVEKAEEPKTETTAPKRQSVFGTLGRRASKAFRGIASPRKETAAPGTTEAKEETAATSEATKAAEDAPVVNGETTAAAPEAAPQNSIGDVVPEAVNVGQPQHATSPTVTASA